MGRRAVRTRAELAEEAVALELYRAEKHLPREVRVRLELYRRAALGALEWAITLSGDPVKPTRMLSLLEHILQTKRRRQRSARLRSQV